MITVKKLTKINNSLQAVVNSMRPLSKSLSEFENMLTAFDVDKDNPLFVSAKQLTDDYLKMCADIRQVIIAKNNIENEILVEGDN